MDTARKSRRGAALRRACVMFPVLCGLLALPAPSGAAAGRSDPTGEPSIAVPYRAAELWQRGITGKGVTVAVLVSYGDPRLEEFIEQYDGTYGLPPADIRHLEPLGKVPSCTDPGVDTANCRAWQQETRVDVAMIHSLAPGARIVVTAIPVDETQGETGMPEMMAALDHLTEHGTADVVSMSFGTPEQNFADPDSVHRLGRAFTRANRAGVTLVASSGDHGATGPLRDRPDRTHDRRVVAWPASDPRVTAVGAVQLHVDREGNRTAPDTLWPKSGAGHSSSFARPWWQRSAAGRGEAVGRSVPDVTMQGAIGTSQSAALFAGVVALAVQQHGGRLGDINPRLYRLGPRGGAAGITDVTEGRNDYGGVPGFAAGPGFDTASGWGTVDVPRFVRELAGSDR
ncbi:S8 family serine peptidase [Kitasatospora sp. NPDC018619]|uniref:S53 family peptidase n=1 Tax=unclassified Kitasatospora TaxID=2633591 RepID=UPI0037A1B6AC